MRKWTRKSDTMKDLKELLFRECAFWEYAYKRNRAALGKDHQYAIPARHKMIVGLAVTKPVEKLFGKRLIGETTRV